MSKMNAAPETASRARLSPPTITTYTFDDARSSTRWLACTIDDIPQAARFDVPRQNQGQTVEVAYGTLGRAQADVGDPWKRIIDFSEPNAQPRYYRRVRA
jgi:hypothetical protein